MMANWTIKTHLQDGQDWQMDGYRQRSSSNLSSVPSQSRLTRAGIPLPSSYQPWLFTSTIQINIYNRKLILHYWNYKIFNLNILLQFTYLSTEYQQKGSTTTFETIMIPTGHHQWYIVYILNKIGNKTYRIIYQQMSFQIH